MTLFAPRFFRLSPILFAAAWAAPLGAQTIFPVDQELTTSPEATLSLVGDLDGDGINDFLLTSFAEAKVKWMRGLGSGEFANPIDLGLWDPPFFQQTIVDLDSDGRPDILFVHKVDNGATTYRWARQVGDLEFEVTEVLSFQTDIEEPILTDLGGSGAGNFAFVQQREQVGAEIYRWNGATFNASPIVIPIPGVRSLRLLDVNDDGKDDIAAFNATDQVWRSSSYLGGDQFSTPRSFVPAQAALSPGIRIGDIDGDGDSDLVAISGINPSRFLIYERLALGTFSPPTVLDVTGVISDTAPLLFETPFFDLIDYDGDGLLDIQAVIVPVPMDGTVPPFTWFRSLGALNFAAGQNLLGTAIGDVDGDGTQEGRLGAVRPEYLVGGGVSPDPWYSTTVSLGRSLPLTEEASSRDVDGDGDFDIVLETSSEEQFIFENLGGLNFAEFQPAQPPTSDPDELLVLEADFVGDAETDRLIGGDGVRLAIERGLSPGVYAPPVTISSALNGVPHPFDWDGDGDLDILQADTFPPVTRVFFIENIGIGNQFPRRITIDFAEGLRRLLPVDVDSDGTFDLVTLENSVSGPAVRQNLGGGDFGPPTLLDSDLGPNFMVTGALDFNADGQPDLLGLVSGILHWAEKLGPSDYRTPEKLGDGLLTPFLFDVNNDGLLDVVERDRARYRLQTSPGIVGGAVDIAPRIPSPVVEGLADFDGDGDLDAWVSVEGRAMFLVENIATPSAGGPAEVCAAGNPNSTGLSGELRAYGSDSAMSTDLRLSAVQLPPAQFGFFVGSREVGPPLAVPGSSGSICLRGSIGRYVGTGQIQSSSAAGVFSIDLDPMNLRVGAGPVAAMANETWFFQAWHRDVDAGGAPTSQFTNALAIMFTP